MVFPLSSLFRQDTTNSHHKDTSKMPPHRDDDDEEQVGLMLDTETLASSRNSLGGSSTTLDGLARDEDQDNEKSACRSDRSDASDDTAVSGGGVYNISKLRLACCVVAILVSNFSVATDSSLSAASHVAIAAAFHRANLASWLVNSFVVTSMTLQPIYGRLSDYVGRKIPYVIASTCFCIGILFCSVAPSWYALIAARALCGFGSAGVATMGSVLLTDLVGLEKRGYYQSINYVVYGAGSALGSSFGGTLVQELDWSWTYKAQIPLTLTVLCLLIFAIPPQSAVAVRTNKEWNHGKNFLSGFDYKGSLLLMLTLISLFLFLTTGGNIYPWTHPLVLLAGICTIIFAATFCYNESKVEKAVLPLYLLFEFPVRNIMFTGFLSSMINYTVLYNVPMFFQAVHLDSVREAGLRLLFPSLSFTIASATTGWLCARRKSPALTLYLGQGFLFVGTASLVVMATVFPGYDCPNWLYDAFLVPAIIGVGMMAPSTVLTLLNITPSEDQAVANTCLIMMRSLGVFTGTTISTTVLQNSFHLAIKKHNYDEHTKQIIETVRQDVAELLKLGTELQSQVVTAFRIAFGCVFGTCLLAATLIVLSLLRAKIEGFRESEYKRQGKSIEDEAESVEMESIRRR